MPCTTILICLLGRFLVATHHIGAANDRRPGPVYMVIVHGAADRPCWKHYEAWCECFEPEDTYKGLPVYYSSPYCKSRADGNDEPDGMSILIEKELTMKDEL